MISVFALIIGAFVYMWYRNNKNMKDKSIFSEIENNDVIVGTIINVQITKERDPRECLITVETSGGKYIETKIIVPIIPLKGRYRRYYMKDPSIGDETKCIKKGNVFVSDYELKYRKQWNIDFFFGILKYIICIIIACIIIFIHEVYK